MSSTTFYNSQNLVGIGSVGIGTTNPGAPLTVGDLATVYQNGTTSITKLAVGDSTVAASGQVSMYIGKNSSSNNGFFLNHNHVADGSSSNYFKILGYGINAAGFCVRSDGNVGVGTTNPSLGLLHVQGGDVYASANVYGDTGNARWRLQPQYNASSPFNDYFRITNNWDPIKGTFDSSSYAACGINLNSYQSGSQIEFYTTATNNAVPTQRAIILASGYVGIGTTNPGAPVVGVSTLANPGNAGIAQFLAPNITNGYQARICLGQRGGSDSATPSDGAYIDYTNYSSAGSSKNTFSIGFTQGAADVFFVQSSGNVGIGTTNPNYKLDIQGGNLTVQNGGNSVGQGSNVYFVTNTTNFPMAAIGGYLINAIGTLGSGYDTGDLIFYTRINSGSTPALTEKMRVTNAGNVGIGTTNPGRTLSVASGLSSTGPFVVDQTATFTDTVSLFRASQAAASTFQLAIFQTSGGGALQCQIRGDGLIYSSYLSGTTTTLSVDGNGGIIRTPSDARLKNNIQNIQYGLDEINALRPVTHTWIDQKYGSGRQIGMIAQEVAQILPEVVGAANDEDHTLSLDYQKVVPVLVKAVQELSAKNADLESRLAALEAKLA